MPIDPSPDFGIFVGKQLPKSCIESAVHVIQCYEKKAASQWKNAETTTKGVGVWAMFGNAMFCISRVTDVHEKFVIKPVLTDFDGVNILLKPGRGIALANCLAGDAIFNMHFGAVLAGNLTKMTLTDLSEDNSEVLNVCFENEVIVTKSTTVIADFRGGDYTDPKTFKVGLLISENDSEFTDLKKKISESYNFKIFDED